MIVFCEDCGGKNSVPSNKIKNKIIIFTCILCAYPNKYILESTNKTNSAKNPISIKNSVSLSQIISFKDILGGLVYHRNDGVLVNHMPKILSRADLDFLGVTLLKNIDICQKLDIQIQQMILYISHRHTAVRQINANCIVVVIAATQQALHQVLGMINHLNHESFQLNG